MQAQRRLRETKITQSQNAERGGDQNAQRGDHQAHDRWLRAHRHTLEVPVTGILCVKLTGPTETQVKHDFGGLAWEGVLHEISI